MAVPRGISLLRWRYASASADFEPRVGDVMEAPIGILLETSAKEPADRLGNLRWQRLPVGIARENRGHGVRHGLTGVEHRAARQHLVNDAAERPDI